MRNGARNVYPEGTLKAKKEKQDTTQPEFWSQRYASGRTPWQTDHVPERLGIFLRSLRAGGSILIPGCGEDFRTIAAFRGAGQNVTAIDFSPIAVKAMKKALPEMCDDIILGDFFRYNFSAAPFDLVYERTFLCSLPPRSWKNYAARVEQLLASQGVLAGFFFYGDEPDPPPYPLTESKASEFLGRHFELQTSEPVTDSLPVFGGNELWQEWRVRDR